MKQEIERLSLNKLITPKKFFLALSESPYTSDLATNYDNHFLKGKFISAYLKKSEGTTFRYDTDIVPALSSYSPPLGRRYGMVKV